MHSRRLKYFLFAFFAINFSVVAQTHQDQTVLQKTHEALFESYFPIHRFDSNPEIQGVLHAEEDASWAAFSYDPRISPLLTLFNNLPQLGSYFQSEPIRKFVTQSGKASFQDLTDAQREQLLYLMQTSSSNDVRSSAMLLRNSYLSAIYHSDKVMEAVTGVMLPPIIRPDLGAFLSKNTPSFPGSNLSYDAQHGELQCSNCTIDYLIVGSGPAGSVIASELRKKGYKVVVVERGPFVIPGTLETRSFAQLQEAAGRRSSADGSIYFRNGNSVGGGTTVNVDLAFSPTLDVVSSRIQKWRLAGEINADEFSPNQVAQAYQWVMQEVGTRILSEEEINTNNRVLWDGAKKLHLHPKLYHLNTYAPGTTPYEITDKKSALTQFLLPAMQEKENPITLLPDTEVLRVLFDKTNNSQKAIGVEVKAVASWQQEGILHDPYHLSIPTGAKFVIHAKNVILSAGAFGSSTILLHSSVPNSLIGSGVIIHPSIPLIGVMKNKTHILQGTQASVFVDDFLKSKGLAFEAMSADPGYAAIMLMGDREQSFQVTSQFSHLSGFGVMMIDRPVSGNRVLLDENSNPQIEYALTEEAKERFRFGISEAVRIMFAAGAERVYIPSNENIFGTKENRLHAVMLTNVNQIGALKNLQFISNRTIFTSAHMQATDKAGASPSNSVVSPEFQVWGTENLYVLDSSIFPESIGANPMQSIYTFAKIFADNLVKPAN
jgi:hypothetical protein